MAIPVVVVDRHFWAASSFFNPNAFPPDAKSEASLCGDRLAILRHSVEVLKADPGLDRQRLLADDLVLPKMPDGAEVTAYCDALVSRTEALLFETLSFLPRIDSSLLLRGERAR